MLTKDILKLPYSRQVYYTDNLKRDLQRLGVNYQVDSMGVPIKPIPNTRKVRAVFKHYNNLIGGDL